MLYHSFKGNISLYFHDLNTVYSDYFILIAEEKLNWPKLFRGPIL